MKIISRDSSVFITNYQLAPLIQDVNHKRNFNDILVFWEKQGQGCRRATEQRGKTCYFLPIGITTIIPTEATEKKKKILSVHGNVPLNILVCNGENDRGSPFTVVLHQCNCKLEMHYRQ